MQKRQKFTAEFKREAIRRLQASDQPTSAVAKELGISPNRLYKWLGEVDKKGAEAFPGSGRPKVELDTLARLQRDYARLKEENEILKKAAAYFARELP
jgi:transposase